MHTLSRSALYLFFLLALASMAITAAANTPEARLATIPLAFEPASEQGASYVARSKGYAVRLDREGAQMRLIRDVRQRDHADQIALRFVGSQSTLPEPDQKLPGVSNYYLGKQGWRQNVPTYAQIRYDNLYPGVAAVFYGTGQQLEYDLQVAPGADPSVIALEFRGLRSARVDEQGKLHLALKRGELIQHAPVTYQIDDQGERVSIPSAYRLSKTKQAARVSLRIGQYDASRPLIIDPVLSYSSYFGGSGDEGFEGGVAVDKDGNILLAGWTASTDFPTANSVQGSFQGWIDAVVVKLDPTGQRIIYSTYLGGKKKTVRYNRLYWAIWGYDYSYGIAVDSAGNAYITGKTSSPDFPVTPGAWDTTCGDDGQCDEPPKANNDRYDSFVTKLSPTGGLVYSTFLGGNNHDIADAIAVDSAGNAIVTGWTASTTFPLVGALQTSLKGYTSAFITKLNANGSGLIFSTYLGGTVPGNIGYYAYTHGTGVAVDGSDNFYVTGDTSTSDFPTTPGVVQPAYSNGYYDGYIAKFSPTGTLLYSTFLGGVGTDKPESIAVDAAGNAYVAGETNSPDFPRARAIQNTYAGGTNDAFVSELSADGSQLIYSTYLGGSGNDVARGIAVDAAGRAHVSGYTDSTNFPVHNAVQSANAGGIDAFLTKFDVGGDSLFYSSYLGGTVGAYGAANDLSYGVALDTTGTKAYIAGSTQSNDFPLVAPYQNHLNQAYGISDAFIAVFTASDSDQPTTPLPPPAPDLATGMYASAASVFVGANLSYTINVVNVGTATASGVTLNDTLPSGLTLVSVSSTLGTCTTSPTISCNLGSLAAGASASITLTVNATAAGTFVNSATSIHNTVDPTPANNTATATTSVTVQVIYALNVAKAGTGSGTVTSIPYGINCGADCTENYNSGTAVSLSAVAAGDSIFAGWSGDADCSDGIVTLNGNLNCTATFNKIVAAGSCVGTGGLFLRGKVENDNGGVSGVTLALSGPNGCTANTLTDSTGYYEFISLGSGSYTAIPSKGSGCSFSPASASVNLADGVDLDITTTCQ